MNLFVVDMITYLKSIFSILREKRAKGFDNDCLCFLSSSSGDYGLCEVV